MSDGKVSDKGLIGSLEEISRENSNWIREVMRSNASV